MARERRTSAFYGTLDRIKVGRHAKQVLEILQGGATTQSALCQALSLPLGELLQVLEALERQQEVHLQYVQGTFWVHPGGRSAV